MGPTAEELRQDIEDKRLELGDDLTVLGDRVSPAQIAQRKRVEYGFRARQAFDAVAAKVHPGSTSDDGAATPATEDFDPSAASGTPSVIHNPVVIGTASLIAGVVIGAVLARWHPGRSTSSAAT